LGGGGGGGGGGGVGGAAMVKLGNLILIHRVMNIA
jgi:hypothetical protein